MSSNVPYDNKATGMFQLGLTRQTKETPAQNYWFYFSIILPNSQSDFLIYVWRKIMLRHIIFRNPLFVWFYLFFFFIKYWNYSTVRLWGTVVKEFVVSKPAVSKWTKMWVESAPTLTALRVQPVLSLIHCHIITKQSVRVQAPLIFSLSLWWTNVTVSPGC